MTRCKRCGAAVDEPVDYKPEYCCSGEACDCGGLPLNPILCDKCIDEIWGSTDG